MKNAKQSMNKLYDDLEYAMTMNTCNILKTQ